MRLCQYYRQVCRRADGKCRLAKPVNGLAEWQGFVENVQGCHDKGPPIPPYEGRWKMGAGKQGRIRIDAEEWVKSYEKRERKGGTR